MYRLDGDGVVESQRRHFTLSRVISGPRRLVPPQNAAIYGERRRSRMYYWLLMDMMLPKMPLRVDDA